MEHALHGSGRILLLYGDDVIEIEEQPWQIGYFNWLTDDEAKRRARQRGQAIERSLYPVWAVRTGAPEKLTARPITLAQAIRICKSSQADNAPRYQAE